jgi:uncharacterized protein (TIGR00255 family)
MTGFGHGEHRDERVQITLEIRSYNNRYLEVYANLPYSLRQLEPRVREYFAARVQRGKVELYLSIVEFEEPGEVVIDHARVKAYRAALEELRRTAGIREKPGLGAFLALEGVLKPVSRRDPEALWALVAPLLDRVFGEFNASRVVEGRRTEQDIRRSAAAVRDGLATIEAHVPEIEERIRAGLRERFRELLGEGIDESRVLAETAVQLMRSDVNEEVQRMKSHLDSLDEALGRDGPQGKRLDFVCQELGREINTIGSKSMTLEIDRAVIGVKDRLEQIREQLRNVE